MNALILLFYRIVAFFTRVPSKTCTEHASLLKGRLISKDSLKTGFINNQGDYFDIPYGKGNMGLNGCGPIAVLNALVALNEVKIHDEHNCLVTHCDENEGDNDIRPDIYSSFISILTFFEKTGATLKGKFGTSPMSINKYLKKRGFNTSVIRSKNSAKINAFSENYPAFISVICNDGKSIKKGLHYICTKKNEDGSFTSHNPERTGASLYETLNKCSQNEIRHVYTIGIKRRETC